MLRLLENVRKASKEVLTALSKPNIGKDRSLSDKLDTVARGLSIISLSVENQMGKVNAKPKSVNAISDADNCTKSAQLRALPDVK